MGMYDNVKLENWEMLPDPPPQEIEFQTKSLDNQLHEYTITKDGKLIHHDFDLEVVPDDELPYKDDPSPFKRMFGCLRHTNERDVEVNLHGIVNFYGDMNTGEIMLIDPLTGKDSEHPGARPEWFEYNAYFIYGKLDKIERVYDSPWA